MDRVIGIVGFSGSGKTTLIEGLIPLLSGRQIALVKRTHHEQPGFSGGKDTDRYLGAGAAISILVTPRAIHFFSAQGHRESPLVPVNQIVREAAEQSDVVIIESAMYDGDWPRVLVHSSVRGWPDPLPPLLKGVVTAGKQPVPDGFQQFDRDDLEGVARFVIRITS